MRSIVLPLPSRRDAVLLTLRTRRTITRSARATTDVLRPHAPLLRLALLFALAFLLAFYLDTRDLHAHGSDPADPSASEHAAPIPTGPAPRPRGGSVR